MTAETKQSVRRLAILAAVMYIGHLCHDALRFSSEALNSIFYCGYLAIPFLAIQPVWRLHKWHRALGGILLAPLLFFSSCGLVFTIVFDGLGGFGERIKPLQTIQQGSSTVELADYEHGGSVGVHGISLEQRRLLFPGLYLVKSIDFFDDAREATLSVEGPYRIRVHARGNYSSDDFQIDKAYSLKPWIYF